MTLVLRNLQIVIPLRRAVLRRNMEALRHILGVKEYDLGVICVDNRKIQLINYQYKKKNCPTDVLSFPFQENLAAGELPQPSFPDDYNLGDIFLGVEFIYQQCQEQKDDFYSVMTMFEKEKQILEVLSRLTGRNLQPLTENYNSLSRTHTPVIKRETCPKIGFEQLTKDNLQASD
ncbi:endoribonuclease YbeY isoform X4 [Microcaecilia unicolor]|uniref:Endoribonuclease YbeY isoform X4 n=1 Tax=Microcaecilia unicolor TaxID=1415580 RepID=A0A6P7YGI6_9AMPH|nr:endoribonuclease YbeY isoform X4 [Microcaecilia unicolor]